MFDVAAANVAADVAANVAAGNEVIHISHSFALSLPGLTAPQIRYLNKTLHFLRIYLHMYIGEDSAGRGKQPFSLSCRI